MKMVFEMKQERAKAVAAMRGIMDKYADGKMSGEDAEAYAKAEKDFDALNERIMAREKLIERERLIGEKQGGDAEKVNERMEMFARALSGNSADVSAYRNAYTLGTEATAGALTAPMEFVEQLIKGLDDLVFMRAISHKTPTIGAAESLGFPYRKTEASDAEWTTEIAEAPEENTLSFGRREFRPYRMAKLIKLSKTLVNHSNMADRVVREALAEKIAATQEKAYLLGDGSAKPLGVFTLSESGISADRDVTIGNKQTEITADGLIEAKYALKQQYMRRAQWIMHRDAVKMVAKLKNTDGSYIWQESLIAGQPDRLLGMPVNMSEFAPKDFTAGKYVAVLGDFGYYWICDADAVELQVLREIYATSNQIGYLTNYFGDGMPVLGEAFARVKLATA